MNPDVAEILSVLNVSTRYGLNIALQDINMVVNKSEVVSVVGANGAGKSTLLKTIMGLCPVYRGHILFQGVDISRNDTERIVRSGIAMVPEGRQLFGPMTVKDNLILGAYIHLGFRRPKKDVETNLEEVFNLFPILRERQKQKSATLSGGEQQMLAIGRGLMSRPSLLLVDEMSMGLAPIIVKQILKTIEEMNKSGVSILLVEQNIKVALQVSHRAYILDKGRLTFGGSSEALLADEKLISAYLG
jgi:branched-chain amino acid transport system ATP-binding protein